MYDVYYTTGGGPWVNAGTDLWVNDFIENIVPHLKVRPVLLIHRNKPKGFEDFEFPIETHWQGDNVGEFEKICDGARRINILHGHYTPMKAIVNNKKNLCFLDEIDKLCIKYEILPSIIKDSRIKKVTFDKCYKEAQEFRDKLRDFDKDRIYKSELSSRLEI